jgi:hypothetical protein
VRSLIEKVVFIPLEGLGKFELEIQGNLARLLRTSGAAGGQTTKSPVRRASGALDDWGAGARIPSHLTPILNVSASVEGVSFD